MAEGEGPAVRAARWLAAETLHRLAREIVAGKDDHEQPPAEARALAAEAAAKFGVTGADFDTMMRMAVQIGERALNLLPPLQGSRDVASEYRSGPRRSGMIWS